jgi:hypothetical protein
MSITPIVPEYEECALWPVDPACLTPDWEALDPAIQARSLALASATLRRLSGYRVTNCPITVRPCKTSCLDGHSYLDYSSTWMPHISTGGYWVNSCGCTTDCSCTEICSIRLPGPVGRVDEVLVGADDITADVRIAGTDIVYVGTEDCPFPTCQNLSADPGEEGTFAVTYINGYPPDALAAYAAGILAMEYAKACTGSKACKLPIGTTSVVRQGVSIEIATGSFPNGMTGIREVDAWIALWRPEGSPRWHPRVWSPDLRSPRIQH